MEEKWCKAYKEWGIFKNELCKLCIARNCVNRYYDYDLAGRRYTMRSKEVETVLVNGQWEWMW